MIWRVWLSHSGESLNTIKRTWTLDMLLDAHEALTYKEQLENLD